MENEEIEVYETPSTPDYGQDMKQAAVRAATGAIVGLVVTIAAQATVSFVADRVAKRREAKLARAEATEE